MAWPNLEMQMAMLLALLLKAETDATLAVYLSLRRSTSRYDAISAAANVSLDRLGCEYILASLKVIQSAEGERNALAHAVWGYSTLIDDGIIWVSENDAVHFHATAHKNTKSKLGIDFSVLAAKAYVYTLKDLTDIEKKISQTVSLINSLKLYVQAFYDKRPPDVMNLLSQRLETFAPMREPLRLLRESGSRKICECCLQPIKRKKAEAPL